jgi:hypothetical protein
MSTTESLSNSSPLRTHDRITKTLRILMANITARDERVAHVVTLKFLHAVSQGTTIRVLRRVTNSHHPNILNSPSYSPSSERPEDGRRPTAIILSVAWQQEEH